MLVIEVVLVDGILLCIGLWGGDVVGLFFFCNYGFDLIGLFFGDIGVFGFKIKVVLKLILFLVE